MLPVKASGVNGKLVEINAFVTEVLVFVNSMFIIGDDYKVVGDEIVFSFDLRPSDVVTVVELNDKCLVRQIY